MKPDQISSSLFSLCLLPSFLLLFCLCAATKQLESGDSTGYGMPSPKGYVCAQAASPILIDGKMSEPAWQMARWTDDFVDIEGELKPRPRFRTRVKMLWDDQYFYVGAELEEPQVWATLTKRDTIIFHDNDFEIFIDPDGDNHEYYEFEMNALNTGWDLLLLKPYRDGGPPIDSWDIKGLKTAVYVDGTLNDPSDTDKGWCVEMAIPWSALKEYAHRETPPAEGDQWRMNFSRVEWETEIVDGKYQKVNGKREDNWVWSPQGVVDMHRPELWGYVQFTKSAGGKTEFYPDQSLPARNALIQIYYAQKRYYDKWKRWASSLEDLDVEIPTESDVLTSPMLKATEEGFITTVVLRLPNGKTQQWHIRQDSRIWFE